MFMRKFYLLFAALFAFSLVTEASIKNLYKQDFEVAKNAADAGWISPNNADGMKVAGDAYGSFFQFTQAGGGDRNAYTLWGTDLYGEGVNQYKMKFDFSPTKKGDTNLSSEVVVFADSTWLSNGRWNNQNYRKTADQITAGKTEPNRWWLFDLTELTDEAKEGDTWAVNGDSVNFVKLAFDGWYTVTLDVDVTARTVAWGISDEFGTPIGTGIYNVPAEVENLHAAGMNLLGGRTGSVNKLDNILIQVATAEDFANKPTVALTGVNGVNRSYTVSIEESNNEVLHVTFNGTELTPDANKEGGLYIFNLSSSGKLVAWTESGSATSEKEEVDVVAEWIQLPAVVPAITGVVEGFGKTYKVALSNADVPTQPDIFFNYTFKGVSGDVKSKENCVNGESITVTEKGTFEFTTHDGGLDAFKSTTIEYANDIEFAVKDDIDFQHMTVDDLTAKGFSEIETLASTSTSGENNWTARGDALRFNWVKGTNVGDTAWVRPYDANHGIRRFVKAPSTLTEEVAHSLFAPVYTWFTKTGDGSDMPQMKFNFGIGLIQTGILGDAQDGKITYNNATLGVDGLTEDDFIIVNRIDNYGRSKTDDIFVEAATEEEAIAKYNALNWAPASGLSVIKGNETFTLYRIDTALARVRTFVAKNPTGIETLPYNKVVSDHNAPIYNLNGVQVNPNALQKGIYIKQGKKFIVR